MSTNSQTFPNHDKVAQTLCEDQGSPTALVGQQKVEVDPNYVEDLTQKLREDIQDVDMDLRPHQARRLATPYHFLSDYEETRDWSTTPQPTTTYS